MAIDPSLRCSGWALFHMSTGRLCAVGKVRSLPPAEPLAVRLADLQARISQIYEKLSLCSNDVVVCEAPTTMRDPRAALKVEQVRGLFETVARDLGIRVPGRINPRSVQADVMGLRGAQIARANVKHAAINVARALYAGELARLGFEASETNMKRNQDIIDALLIGNLALVWLKAAVMAGTSLEEYFGSASKLRRVG